MWVWERGATVNDWAKQKDTKGFSDTELEELEFFVKDHVDH